MKTLDELQALVNGYKRGSVRFDYLSDVLRELIADAERYRWLRESRDDGFWKCHEKDGEGGSILKYGVDLDSAIDAARKG